MTVVGTNQGDSQTDLGDIGRTIGPCIALLLRWYRSQSSHCCPTPEWITIILVNGTKGKVQIPEADIGSCAQVLQAFSTKSPS